MFLLSGRLSIYKSLRIPLDNYLSRNASSFNHTPTTTRTIPIPTPVALERLKRSQRGGQNLSTRYQRLETSLRGKEGYEKRISDLYASKDAGSAASTDIHSRSSKANVKTFMGFVIPEEPRPPADDECCMSGCAVCVYDLYQEALEDYQNSLSSLRTSLKGINIPEDQWPQQIRLPAGGTKSSQKPRERDVALSAFEELERRLKMQKEGQPAESNLSDASNTLVKLGPRRKTKVPSVGQVFEGLRWAIFPNR
ncbi:oxidoreductase-like protein [Abortiporus biennis]|nr:oxidoreductase-like protein [Abortiporus biennis]